MTAVDHSQITSTNQVVHLEDVRLRRRERAELVTEGINSYLLLDAARIAYDAHQTDAFLVLNVVAGVALALVVLRGLVSIRRHRDAGSSGTNVVGVFGGLAAITEALHRLYIAQFTFGHKHFALGVFTLLVGIFATIVALMAERLEQRRALRISDAGISMRLNKFRRFDATWREIAALRLNVTEARIIRHSGRARIIPLARLVNRDEVADALTRAARARGVEVTGAASGISLNSIRTVVRHGLHGRIRKP